MSVKFKVGFTISGETLFALFAKMLPIDDLSVEEVGPWPVTGSKLLPKSKTAPTRKPQARKKNNPMRLNMGINGIVLTAMKGKPMRALELQPLLKAAGYSINSINSRLENLRQRNIVERVGDGTWRLKNEA